MPTWTPHRDAFKPVREFSEQIYTCTWTPTWLECQKAETRSLKELGLKETPISKAEWVGEREGVRI